MNIFPVVSRTFPLGVLLCGFAFTQDVSAGAAEYIYTPALEYGEKEIEINLGTTSPVAGSSSQAASIGFGYGAREYWFTEVILKQQRNGSNVANFAEWENKFQFTATGEYPVDTGFITEIEAPLSPNAPWEFKFGPLFQTEFGKLQMNANLLFEHAFGKEDGVEAPNSTNFSYQWQAKYRWQPVIEFGLQGLGYMGKWNDWIKRSDQSHRIGPAVFGKFALGNRQFIRYNAAWLRGITPASPDNTLRLQIEYEF